MNGRITVHCTTKDRHTEVSLLLQSLRTQSVHEFDIIVLVDSSGLLLIQCYFFMSIVNRMKIEGHKIKLLRNEISQGVCHARNTLIENDDFENEYVYRADDDTILEADYFERLLKVISSGYDLASGIVPYNGMPELKREVKNVKPIINRHVLEADYFERLLKVISSGYDLASGIVPYNGMPELKREVKNVKPIINRHALDAEGNIVVR